MPVYRLFFTEQGLIGLDVPPDSNPSVLAERYTFLRRIAVAVQDFDLRLREIEAAHDEVLAAER